MPGGRGCEQYFFIFSTLNHYLRQIAHSNSPAELGIQFWVQSVEGYCILYTLYTLSKIGKSYLGKTISILHRQMTEQLSIEVDAKNVTEDK